MKRFRAPLLLLLLPGISNADPLGAFERLLEMGDVARAAELLEKKMPASPADRSFLQAQVAFYRQAYGDAVRLLKEAGELSSRQDLKSFRDIVTQTYEITKTFKSIETENFVFRYAPGKDLLLPLYAEEALEKAWERIGADLGARPYGKMVVEFYPSWRDFVSVSTLTEEEVRRTGTVALCKFNRLMVTTPRALLKGYAWLDTAAHEFAHAVIQRASAGKAPVWLHEGVAKYMETRWREERGGTLPRSTQALLRRRLEAGSLIPFEKLHPSIAKLPTAEDAAVAFAEVSYFVRYLVEVKGTLETLRALLQRIARGEETRKAIGDLFGAPFSSVYGQYLAWLRTLPLARDPHAKVSGPTLRGEGDLEADEEERGELARGPGSEETRGWIRLGDLLRHERRARAALTEYDKAARSLAEPWAFLENRIASAALASGRRPRALEALDRAAAAEPEYAATFVRRGSLRLASGNLRGAEGDFLRAVRLNPFDPEIHRGLLKIYRAWNNKPLLERTQRVLEALEPK